MKKALITGITGFAGSHLAEFLLEKNIEVYGTKRWRSKTENIDHISNKIKFINADLRDAHSVKNAIKQSNPDFVFHLGAQSFVPMSWSAPTDTFDTNVLGTINLFEAIRNSGCDPIIQVACCYDKETRAFTDNGLKYYKDLKETDKVLSINHTTNEISFKKIKKIIVQKYNGKLLNFKSKSCDISVTPNHKMLVKKNKNKQAEFIQADKIQGRNLLCLGETKSNNKLFDEDLYYLIGIFIGDGYIVPTKKILKWSGLSHNEYVKNRNKKGQFIKVDKKQVKEYASNRIFFAIPKKDKARKNVERILTLLGVNYSKYDKELYLSNIKEDILELFKECGKCAKNKRIPKKVLDSNKNCLLALFKGLIDSDGYYRKNRFGFTTVSEGLMEDMIELCSKIGKWVTVSKPKERKIKIKNRIINSGKSYILSITEGEKILTKTTDTNKKEIDYKGNIWCVEVEDNHNLLVERNGKVAFCGNSSEEYGLVHPSETPIKEINPLRPLSPYGVSKVAQDFLAYQYFKSYGLKTVRTRAFNHTGCRRGDVFICSTFAKQIAEIEKGIKESVIYVGNLEAQRDFTDVRDMVRAYWLAVNKCDFGEVYNICSGKAYTMKFVLDSLLKLSNKKNVRIEQDPNRMRPSDVPLLLGDNTKFREKTGWRPLISFEKTLLDTLDYWRGLVR